MLVWIALRRSRPGLDADNQRDGALFFVAGIPLLFPWHFEHWSNLLGEAPAAILLLLAFALIAPSRITARTVGLASLACSLAFLCKILAAPGYFVLLGVVLFRLVFAERRPIRDILRLLAISVAVFGVPLLLFEVYKLISLGSPRLYWDLAAQKFAFIGSQGVGSPSETSLLTQVVERDGTILRRFGVSVLQVVITTLLALWLVWRRRSPLPWFATALAVTILVLTVYFVFLSNGWPRYFIIALILWLALMAAALASLAPTARVVVGVAGLALLFSVNYGKLPYLLNGLENGPFRASEELKSAQEVTALVNAALEKNPSAVFVTQLWPTTADVEYYAQRSSVFRRYTRIGEATDYTVIYNKRFFNPKDAAFQEFLSSCHPPEYETASHVVIRSKQSPAD